MSVDISNNPKYSSLLAEDIEFYERVTSNVTVSHALPFEIPVDSFFRITVRALKFFWTWYENATQEQMLFIPRSEIAAIAPNGGNIDLHLPNGIEAVIDWKAASAQYSMQLNNILKINLLQAYNMSSSSNSGGSFRGGYGGSVPSMSNIIIGMYEAAQYKETFTKGIRANFNKNTQVFRLMTNIPEGLVLQCMTRIQPTLLYDDQLFEDYVTAAVEEQLGKIMMAFDFKLPGNIQINYDEIKENGKDTRKEIEQEIKDSNVNDIIQMK